MPTRGRQPHRPRTADAAAASVAPAAPSLCQRVYDALLEAGPTGLTDEEIERRLRLRHQTASARRRELELAGLVVDSGQRRPATSGRLQVVWRIPAGAQRELDAAGAVRLAALGRRRAQGTQGGQGGQGGQTAGPRASPSPTITEAVQQALASARHDAVSLPEGSMAAAEARGGTKALAWVLRLLRERGVT